MRRTPAAAALATLAATAFLAAPVAAGDPGGGELVGIVYFEDGHPAAGARVALSPGSLNATAGADGTFRLGAPAGHYTVRASADNATGEAQAEVPEGGSAAVVVKIERGAYAPTGSNLFPFLFLGLSMIAVAAGGFYVNRRMAETGIDLNKSFLGGAKVRKPFRRRRKKAPPPPSS